MNHSGGFDRTIDEIIEGDSLVPLNFILALPSMVIHFFLEPFKTTIKRF